MSDLTANAISQSPNEIPDGSSVAGLIDRHGCATVVQQALGQFHTPNSPSDVLNLKRESRSSLATRYRLGEGAALREVVGNRRRDRRQIGEHTTILAIQRAVSPGVSLLEVQPLVVINLRGVDAMALGEPHPTDGLEFMLKSCCGASRLTKRAGTLQDDFSTCVRDQHDRRTIRVFGRWPAPWDHPNPVELGPECPKEVPDTPSHEATGYYLHNPLIYGLGMGEGRLARSVLSVRRQDPPENGVERRFLKAFRRRGGELRKTECSACQPIP